MLLIPTSHALPTIAFSNETTHLNRTTLGRRDCKAIPDQPGQYNCDMNAPTLPQIISHMLDPAYSGTITEESRSIFYTGLNRPGFGQEPMRYLPWILGWLNDPSNNVPEYYTVFDVGPSCKLPWHVLAFLRADPDDRVSSANSLDPSQWSRDPSTNEHKSQYPRRFCQMLFRSPVSCSHPPDCVPIHQGRAAAVSQQHMEWH